MLYAAFLTSEVQGIAPGKQGDERDQALKLEGFW